MPLISIETIDSGAQLGLWHIEESVDDIVSVILGGDDLFPADEGEV